MEVLLTVAAWVTGIGGAALLLAALARKLWQFNKAVVSTVELIGKLPERLDRIDGTLTAQDTKIAEIHHEVKYNNGSSVKDAVDRIELGVKGLYDRMDDAERELEQTRPKPPKPITPARLRAQKKE